MSRLTNVWVLMAAISVLPSVAVAGISHDYWVNPVQTTTEPVSVFTRPGGDGHPLSDCYHFGGWKVDATLHITLLDYLMDPVPFLPAEDIWLGIVGGNPELVFCPGGSIADAPTDANAQTSFSQPFAAGGNLDTSTGPWLLVRSVIGDFCVDCIHLDISVNSADINADHVVNLSDVILFAEDFYGAYNYRSDFNWDGVLNLSDLVLLAPSMGGSCP